MSDEEDIEGQETDYPDEEGQSSDEEFDDFGDGPIHMDDVERLFAEKNRQNKLLENKLRREGSTVTRPRKTVDEDESVPTSPIPSATADLTESESTAYDILLGYYMTVEGGNLSSTDSILARATQMGLLDVVSEESLKKVVAAVKRRLLTKEKNLPGVRARPLTVEEESTRNILGELEFGMAPKIAKSKIVEGSIYGKNMTQLKRIAKQYGIVIPEKPSSRELRSMIKAHIKKLTQEYSKEDSEFDVLTKLKEEVDTMSKTDVASLALKYNVLESSEISRKVLTTRLKNKLETFLGKSDMATADSLGVILSDAATMSERLASINTATRQHLDSLPNMTDQELVNLASRMDLGGIIPFINKNTGLISYTKTNKNKIQLRQLVKQRIDEMIEMLGEDTAVGETYEGVEDVVTSERDIISKAMKLMSYNDVDALKARVLASAGQTKYNIPAKKTMVDRDAPSDIKYGYFTKYVKNERGEYVPLKTGLRTRNISGEDMPSSSSGIFQFERTIPPSEAGKVMTFEPLPTFSPDVFYQQEVTDSLRAMAKRHLSRVIHCVHMLVSESPSSKKDSGEYSHRNVKSKYESFYNFHLNSWIAERLPKVVVSDEEIAETTNEVLDWFVRTYGDDVFQRPLDVLIKRVADGKSTEFSEYVLRELKKGNRDEDVAVELARAFTDAVREHKTVWKNRLMLNEHMVTDEERSEFDNEKGDAVRVAYERQYGKLEAESERRESAMDDIDQEVEEYELAVAAQTVNVFSYLTSLLYPFVFLRPELIPFTISLQDKIRAKTVPISRLFSMTNLDLFPEVYMNNPVAQTVDNRITLMLSNYVDEIIAGHSISTRTVVPFPDELGRFNWDEHVASVKGMCGDSVEHSNNADIVIAQDDDGSFSCHDVEDLLEQFNNGNMINSATGLPFKDDFVQRIMFRGYSNAVTLVGNALQFVTYGRPVKEVKAVRPPAPAPVNPPEPVFAPKRRRYRRRKEYEAELREEDRDIAEAELRQLELTKEALIKAEEKRLKRELTEEESRDLIENEIWTPAYIYADEE